MTKRSIMGAKSVRTRFRKRIIRHAVSGGNVRRAIGQICEGMEIYGITTGQFSFINLIEDIVRQIGGPVDLDISTWTIAHFEISRLRHCLESGQIRRLRLLIDTSFPSRQSQEFEFLRIALGDVVRLLPCHCKFAVVSDVSEGKWNIVIRTSMNLNQNRRLENFEISDCELLADYITDIVSGFFEKPFDLAGVKLKDIGGRLDGDDGGLDALLSDIREVDFIG